jgi:hypothetical protein
VADDENETFRREHVVGWHERIKVLREDAIEDSDAWVVGEAVAGISTDAQFASHFPQAMLLLVHDAMRVGYGRAVQDVRNGKVAGLGPA